MISAALSAKTRAFVFSLLGLAFASLTACGGGGGGGGDMMIMPPPSPPEVTEPDLIVEAPTAPATRKVGQRFIFSARVKNDGTASSAATSLRFYRSTDADISTGDTEIGTEAAVGTLAAAGTSDATINLTAPATAGTYYYGACVDSVADESDTTNNCSSGFRVEVSATPAPDLIVDRAYLSSSEREAGQSFDFTARVRNQGTRSSAATRLRYYRSSDATITTRDDAIGTDNVGTLAANGASNESINLTAPSTAGTYYYGACVDSVADESDTTNNCSSGARISVTATPEPDLIIEAPTAPDTRVVGQSFDFTARVKNDGTAASAATSLRFYRSTDADISTGDTEVGTAAAVGTLAADGTSDESISLTAPATPGTYYYGACVESVADESDTTNNCSSSVSIVVTAAPAPDLIIDQFTVPSQIEAGLTYTITGRIRNQGTAPAAATVRYYQSPDATITTGDTEIGMADDITSLSSAGGFSVFGTTFVAPTTPGTYYYGACVEPVADESDITNNCTSGFEVTVSAPTGNSDLNIHLFIIRNSFFFSFQPELNIDTLTAGGTLYMGASVQNIGGSDSTATTLRYYRSTDATIDSTDTEIATNAVAHIPAGASRTPDTGALTATSTPGTYYYGVCVDAASNETDTSNNCSAGVEVTITAASP